MKTKAISLTLAGLMSLQSVGFAQQDRTANIGNQAITAAQSNLQALNTQILALDQSLAETEMAIKKRDGRGGITNGMAVTGAGAALALTAMAYFTITNKSRIEGAGIGAMLLAASAVLSTFGSSATGGVSQALKTNVDTKELESKMLDARKEAQAALAQATDPSHIKVITQVAMRLESTQEALASYKDQEDDVSRNRLVSQVTQFVGAALFAYGIVRGGKTADVAGKVGMMLTTTANLGALISGLQGSEAKEVLKYIRHARTGLQEASAVIRY